MTTYVVAAVHSWNAAAFHRRTPSLPGDWHLITEHGELTAQRIRDLAPRYVFFPHWSWKVPQDVLDLAECVCFHMTDVPYGRGGSPLQNLIARGHETTMLSALRMVEELDAGPVYAKCPLALDGRAQEIYERASSLVYDLMEEIVSNEPDPVPQSGEVVRFERRTPEMSELPASASPEALYDHIRMLDAEGYPPAFIRHGDWHLEMTHASLAGDEVQARVSIRRADKKVEEE